LVIVIVALDGVPRVALPGLFSAIIPALDPSDVM
jgi:hypothetical protein